MQAHNSQNHFGKTIAAIVGVLALGLLVVWQEVTATDEMAENAAVQTETMPAAGFGYFPAQFQIKHRADESVDLIPTF
ncbi:MAG TPA: hypothetical protein VKD28_09595 [Gemmatimonadales bacterium]|nr:hypothetical protein [Gemmatimonadales bacterium]